MHVELAVGRARPSPRAETAADMGQGALLWTPKHSAACDALPNADINFIEMSKKLYWGVCAARGGSFAYMWWRDAAHERSNNIFVPRDHNAGGNTNFLLANAHSFPANTIGPTQERVPRDSCYIQNSCPASNARGGHHTVVQLNKT